MSDRLQVDYDPQDDDQAECSDGSVVAVDPLSPPSPAVKTNINETKPIRSSGLRRLLQAYVQFMATPLNQDKGLKLLQYTLWVAGQVYGSSNASRKAGLEKLSLDLSWVRMANRLLQWPMALDATVNNSWSVVSRNYPNSFYVMGKMLAVSMVGYYPAEHGAWLHWMVPKWLAQGRSAEVLSFWSCRCWTVYILTEVAQCFLQLRELAHTEADTEDADAVSAKRHALRLQLVRNALWIAPALHWSRSDWDHKPWLGARRLNGLMWLESVVCMYQALSGFRLAEKAE